MEDPIEVRNSDLENLPNHVLDHDVVIVMVPFLAQGHLNQLLQLASLISSSYDPLVYYDGSSTHNQQVRIQANALNPSNMQKSTSIKFQLLNLLQLHLYLMPQADPNHIYLHYGMHLCLCASPSIPFYAISPLNPDESLLFMILLCHIVFRMCLPFPMLLLIYLIAFQL